MIDVNLSAGTILASLRQSGWAEYAVEDDGEAASLMRLVETQAADAGLRVALQREGRLILADVVPTD